jgi:hypothetical protein
MGYFNVYGTSTIYDCAWVIYFWVTICIYVFQKVNIDINDEGLGNCYNISNFVVHVVQYRKILSYFTLLD